MHAKRKLIAAVTALTFGSASLAQTPVEPPPQQQEAEGKFVWGILLKLIAPVVFDYFSEWVKKKVAAKYDEDSFQFMLTNAGLATIVNLSSVVTSKDIVLAGVEPNAAIGTPRAPLTIDQKGENYQGVNVAVVTVDENGKPLAFRALAGGFNTGERFKLRVLPTFDAVVVLGNINPKGASRQIYPAKGGEAISIPAGKEVLLPLGAKEFFKFAGDTGHEQLTFTVRDPRSLDASHAATAQVFRKDEAVGSNFVQSVEPGRYPVIAESIAMEHRATDPK